MDNDEFEFKPLTEGLGFHKKNSSQNIAPVGTLTGAPAAAIQSALKAASPFINSPLSQGSSPFLNSPLPRQTNSARQATEIPKFEQKKFNSAPSSPEIERRPAQPTPISPTKEYYSKKLSESLNSKQALDFREPQWVEVSGHLGSYFFDFIVILGLSCLFALVLSLITEVDLIQVMNTISFDSGIQFGSLLLLASVIQIYLTLSRSFFGATLGEWAFDLQLGKKVQQSSAVYPIQVFWRTAITLITGLITLPILSFLMGKDIASKVCGLKLYKQ